MTTQLLEFQKLRSLRAEVQRRENQKDKIMDSKKPEDLESVRLLSEQYRAILELEKFDLNQDPQSFRGESPLAKEYQHLSSLDSLSLVKSARADFEKRGFDHDVLRSDRLLSWLTQTHVDHLVYNIDRRIESQGAKVRIDLEPGEVLLRDARLYLERVKSAETRSKLNMGRVKAAQAASGFLAERLGIYHTVAQQLGADNFRDLWAQSTQTDHEGLAKLAKEVLAETRDMYFEVMRWTVRRRLDCSLEDANRHDLPYVFAARYTEYDDSFALKQAVTLIRSFLEKMGLSLTAQERLSLLLDDSRDPHRAYICSPRIPDDVRVVIHGAKPIRDFQKILGAVGRAMFLANISPKAAFEDRVLGDGALDLCYSQLFSSLPLDKTWLAKVLGVQRPKDYLIISYLQRLYLLRLNCTRLLYELDLYRSGKTDGAQERYHQIFTEELGVQSSAELFLHEVRRPFLSANQLRGRVFEAIFTLHLNHYFGSDWWQNPQTGQFLIKEWLPGRRLTADQRVVELGYPELTVKPLVKLFTQRL